LHLRAEKKQAGNLLIISGKKLKKLNKLNNKKLARLFDW
jgi:hypothetical protein